MRAILVLALVACGGASVSPAPPAAPPSPREPAEPSEPTRPPAGYVDARVMQVIQRDQGAAVLLVDETSMLVLPIFIGGTEANSIDLRMRGVPPQRPLTHDLLDTLVKKLKGRLVKVQVDELREGVFHGSVFLRIERRVVRVDARPSDAIALAIGNKLPIYVASKVFEEAGMPKDELLRQIAPVPTGPTI